MTTPASPNPISLSDVQAEFSGSHPISLNEYYRGGGFVPSSLTSIPASGAISLSDFRGVTLPANPVGAISRFGGTAPGYVLSLTAGFSGFAVIGTTRSVQIAVYVTDYGVWQSYYSTFPAGQSSHSFNFYSKAACDSYSSSAYIYAYVDGVLYASVYYAPFYF